MLYVGADGLSFSYGLLPPRALGEAGGGLGLRVAFVTGAACAAPHQKLNPAKPASFGLASVASLAP